ncbi:ATP synthase d subunit [Blastocladiella emersonii ATCC 22665]|nr:ATP synthase d subunit [Blastocladiella emersonii ATCC 22665]
MSRSAAVSTQPPALARPTMSAVRASATKALDFGRVATTLKLKQETVAALTAFRKRHDELQRTVSGLREQRQTIDFAHYRSVLRNKEVVDQAEAALKAFAPAKYDLAAQVKVIEAYEAKAIERAQATADAVNSELSELRETLANIEAARPIDQLTVDDVVRAKPSIETDVEERVKNGRWEVEEYNAKFGDARVV